jgi:uncharacterized membrane protein (DUF106 family)
LNLEKISRRRPGDSELSEFLKVFLVKDKEEQRRLDKEVQRKEQKGRKKEERRDYMMFQQHQQQQQQMMLKLDCCLIYKGAPIVNSWGRLIHLVVFFYREVLWRQYIAIYPRLMQDQSYCSARIVITIKFVYCYVLFWIGTDPCYFHQTSRWLLK